MVRREINFFVRVFPTVERDLVNFKIENNRKTLHIRAPSDIGKHYPKHVYWEFHTDGIFCNSCQIDVYLGVVENCVERALKGEDFTIVAFGPTATGKTYTMTGLRGKFEQRGIAPRLIHELFALKKEFAEVTRLKIFISTLEFNGTYARNLLKKGPKNHISIKKSEVPQMECDTEQIAMSLIFDGESRRSYEKGFVSASTFVITIHLDCTWINKSNAHYQSKIHLVDMAGTECITSKARSNTNQILSNMAMFSIDFLLANARGGRPRDSRPVAVRVSPLTEFIGPALLNGSIRFIAHVRLTSNDLLPTLSAMKFGSNVKKLPKPELLGSKKPSSLHVLQSLMQENQSLKNELLLNQLLKGEYRAENMSQEEVQHVTRLAEAYLKDRINESAILAVTQCSVILPIIRNIYKKDLQEIKRELEEAEERMSFGGPRGLLSDVSSHRLSKSKKTGGKSRVSLAKRSGSRLMTRSKSRHSLSMKSRSASSTSAKSGTNIKAVSPPPKQQAVEEESFLHLDIEEPVKDKFWEEFFRRYPELDSQLRTWRYNVVTALRDKEEASKNAIRLRCQLDDALVNLEDAQWRRKATVGDEVGPDGLEVQSELEQQAQKMVEEITRDYLSSREQAARKHAKYLEVINEYNQLNERTRLEFQDYMNKIYTTTLLLPDVIAERHLRADDDGETLVVEPVDVAAEKQREEEVEANAYFEQMQKTHGRNLMTMNIECFKLPDPVTPRIM